LSHAHEWCEAIIEDVFVPDATGVGLAKFVAVLEKASGLVFTFNEVAAALHSMDLMPNGRVLLRVRQGRLAHLLGDK